MQNMSHNTEDFLIKSKDINILDVELVTLIIKLIGLILIIILNFLLFYNIIIMGLLFNIF